MRGPFATMLVCAGIERYADPNRVGLGKRYLLNWKSIGGPDAYWKLMGEESTEAYERLRLRLRFKASTKSIR